MLSKDAYRILKIFAKKYSLPDKELVPFPSAALDSLINLNYIKQDFLGYENNRFAKYSDYHITEEGIAYVQAHSHGKWFKDNWIALLSMIFSFIAASPVIAKALSSILQCIK